MRQLALVAMLLLTVPGLATAQTTSQDAVLEVTCETVGDVAARLLAARDDRQLLHLDDWLVDLQDADPMAASVVCASAPRVLCLEFLDPAKQIGQRVSVNGRVRFVDDSYVVLDPCQVAIVAD